LNHDRIGANENLGSEATAAGGSSFRRVINMIQWTIFALFLLGAAYATWLAVHGSAGVCGR